MTRISLSSCNVNLVGTQPLIEGIKIKNKCFLSHNYPSFQSNIAIMNFLASHTCEIRFNDVIGRNTVPMYSYAKIPKHG